MSVSFVSSLLCLEQGILDDISGSVFTLCSEVSLCILQFLFGHGFCLQIQALHRFTWLVNSASKAMKMIGRILLESTWAERDLVVPWQQVGQEPAVCPGARGGSQPVEHGLQGHGE